MLASPRPCTTPLAGPPGAHIPSAAPSSPSITPDSSYTPIGPTPTTPNRFTCPWKFEGYKAFSSWMASDDDCFLFRRFEGLNAQTILWMQDRIIQIEGKLYDIHKHIEKSPLEKGLANSSFRWDEVRMPERQTLMGELSPLLHHYSKRFATNEIRLALSLVRSVHRSFRQSAFSPTDRRTPDSQRGQLAQTPRHQQRRIFLHSRDPRSDLDQPPHTRSTWSLARIVPQLTPPAAVPHHAALPRIMRRQFSEHNIFQQRNV
jgi:hypothetical protein